MKDAYLKTEDPELDFWEFQLRLNTLSEPIKDTSFPDLISAEFSLGLAESTEYEWGIADADRRIRITGEVDEEESSVQFFMLDEYSDEEYSPLEHKYPLPKFPFCLIFPQIELAMEQLILDRRTDPDGDPDKRCGFYLSKDEFATRIKNWVQDREEDDG